MIETDVAVCNQALYLIGANRIDDLSEGSPSSRACSQFYVPTKDEVLCENPVGWNCAIKRVQLADLAETYYTSWAYQYQLPTDPYCLKVLALLDFVNETYAEIENEPYEVEGRVLLCGQEKVGIKYIARVTDESELDSWVAEVLVFKMAFKISQKLGNKSPADMYQLYLKKLHEARQIDGMNRKNREKPQKALESWVDQYL